MIRQGLRTVPALILALCSVSQARSGLSVRIKTDKATYSKFEPVKITATIANHYEKIVILSVPAKPLGAVPPVDFSVRREEDAKEWVLLAPTKIRSTHKARRSMPLLVRRSAALRSGESATITTYLNPWFDLRREGTYAVSCRYTPVEAIALAAYVRTKAGEEAPHGLKAVVSSNSIDFEVVSETKERLEMREAVLIRSINGAASSREAKRDAAVSLASIGSPKALAGVVRAISGIRDQELIAVVERALLTIDDADTACTTAADLLRLETRALRSVGIEVLRLRGGPEHARLLRGLLDDKDNMTRWYALLAVDTLLGSSIGKGLKSPPEIGGAELRRAKALLEQN